MDNKGLILTIKNAVKCALSRVTIIYDGSDSAFYISVDMNDEDNVISDCSSFDDDEAWL